MLPLQARFATQDQAESVMRKLASLRSDCFRLERASATMGAEQQAYESTAAESFYGLTSSVLEGSAVHSSNAAAEYTLSANVPGAVAEQARTVIIQAGGQVMS